MNVMFPGYQRARISARLQELTGETLDQYVKRCREPAPPGRPATWRGMAADVADRTGLSVSYEALRRWYGQQEEAS